MEKVTIIWIYIVRGENGKYYTGITNDIARRLKEHTSGSSRSTRQYGVIELIWTHTVNDRKKARELEVLIKRKGAKRFMEKFSEIGVMESEKGMQLSEERMREIGEKRKKSR